MIDESDAAGGGPRGDDRPLSPSWQFPVPFGRGAATDTMTGVAAPLLAGFSLALLGVVAQAPGSFRLPGAALFTLTATTILMVGCVQLGFRARSYLYSAADISSWWPEPRPPIVTEALQRQQAGHFALWLRWSNRARVAYNAAIIMLACGVALVLAPPDSYDPSGVPLSVPESSVRWAACVLAAAAGIGELGWAMRGRVRATAASRAESREGADDESGR